jgi:hypothetical protein
MMKIKTNLRNIEADRTKNRPEGAIYFKPTATPWNWHSQN